MDPFAHRIHQHRARPVEQVAGGNHLPAWSQEVPFGRWRSGCGTPEDAEDGSEWGVCVCVGRSVERIETQQVLGLGCDAQRLGTLHLLGCDARDELGPGKGLAHDLVGVDVEFLLRIAGGPDPRRSGVASECGPAHLVGENATGEGDLLEEDRELSGRGGMPVFFFDDVSAQRDAKGHRSAPSRAADASGLRGRTTPCCMATSVGRDLEGHADRHRRIDRSGQDHGRQSGRWTARHSVSCDRRRQATGRRSDARVWRVDLHRQRRSPTTSDARCLRSLWSASRTSLQIMTTSSSKRPSTDVRFVSPSLLQPPSCSGPGAGRGRCIA